MEWISSSSNWFLSVLNADDPPEAVPKEVQRTAASAGLDAEASMNADSLVSVPYLRYAIVLIGAPVESNQ